MLSWFTARTSKDRCACLAWKEERNIAHEVLDEDGIIVSLHGHMAFVGTLEEGINGS